MRPKPLKWRKERGFGKGMAYTKKQDIGKKVRTMLISSKATAVHEGKRLNVRHSESELAGRGMPTAESFIARLKGYGVISFDIFDTLLFRPFSDPADLFYFVGGKIGVPGFQEARIQAEEEARRRCRRERGHGEVTLCDIWEAMQRRSGVFLGNGMQAELDMERQFCYANPFMLRVYGKLQKLGKEIILVSDMYLPKEFLEGLLQENGYTGYSRLYVSCEYGKSKADGTLFALVRREHPGSVIHVGDNIHSDIAMAKRNGFAALHYPNINRNARKYRAYGMSPIVGGAYRGLVDSRLYSGLRTYGMNYEYGFVYGGLFVTGYCAFIHEYCKNNQIDRLMFLSGGGTLGRAYETMFPGESTEHVCWPGRAVGKPMAEEEQKEARAYCSKLLRGCKKAVAVDIGWAGSRAASLALFAQEAGFPCEVTGIAARINMSRSAGPDVCEMLLQSGKLVAYLHSQDHSRSLWKRRGLDGGHDIYWELLLSSPAPQQKGLCYDGDARGDAAFWGCAENQEGIREIQEGVLDFVRDYKEHFLGIPSMYSISARDAYAPMLLAACKKGRHLKKIGSSFLLRTNVSS